MIAGPPLSATAALTALIQARGQGEPKAWQTLQTKHPKMAEHLATFGEKKWDALDKEVKSRKTKGFFALQALKRAAHTKDERIAREAWEAVRGAGGADNGGDLGYLQQIAPTAAARLQNAAADADVREARAWFPWTKKKARANAWAWSKGYLNRGLQPKDSVLLSWQEDFDHDLSIRVANDNPKAAYAATYEGAALAWARDWAATTHGDGGDDGDGGGGAGPSEPPDFSHLFTNDHDDDDDGGGGGSPPLAPKP